MFKFTASFKPVSYNLIKLAKFAKGLATLGSLGKEVCTVLVEENKYWALQGDDKDEKPYAPLKAITLKSRDGDGPPLAPKREASRVITNYYANNKTWRGKLNIQAGWKGDVDFLKYHFTGYRSRAGNPVPARNPNAIRPQTLAKINTLVDEWFQNTAKAAFNVTTFNTP